MIHKTNKDVPSLTMVNNKFCLFNKVFITKHHLTCDTCHLVSPINKPVELYFLIKNKDIEEKIYKIVIDNK